VFIYSAFSLLNLSCRVKFNSRIVLCVLSRAARAFLKSGWKKQLRNVDLSIASDYRVGLSTQWPFPYIPHDEISVDGAKVLTTADKKDEEVELNKSQNVMEPICSEVHDEIEISEMSEPSKSEFRSFQMSSLENKSHKIAEESVRTPGTKLLHSDSANVSKDSISDRERMRLLRDEFPDLLKSFRIVKTHCSSHRDRKHREPGSRKKQSKTNKHFESSTTPRCCQTAGERQNIAYDKMAALSSVQTIKYMSSSQFELKMNSEKRKTHTNGSNSSSGDDDEDDEDDDDDDDKVRLDEDTDTHLKMQAFEEYEKRLDDTSNNISDQFMPSKPNEELLKESVRATLTERTIFSQTVDLDIKAKQLSHRCEKATHDKRPTQAVLTEIQLSKNAPITSKSWNKNNMDAFNDIYMHSSSDVLQRKTDSEIDLKSFDPSMTQTSLHSPPTISQPAANPTTFHVSVRHSSSNSRNNRALSSINHSLRTRPMSAPLRSSRVSESKITMTETIATDKSRQSVPTVRTSDISGPSRAPLESHNHTGQGAVAPLSKIKSHLNSPLIHEKHAYSWGTSNDTKKIPQLKTKTQRSKSKLSSHRL
jgi:hypothetical protein